MYARRGNPPIQHKNAMSTRKKTPEFKSREEALKTFEKGEKLELSGTYVYFVGKDSMGNAMVSSTLGGMAYPVNALSLKKPPKKT